VSIRSLVLTAAVAASLGAGSVSAAPRPSTLPSDIASCTSSDCGAFGTPSGGVRGAVHAQRRSDGNARIVVSVMNNLSTAIARVVASAKACSDAHTPADRILRYSFGATQAGSFAYATATVPLEGDLAHVRSYRFVGKGGATACTQGYVFQNLANNTAGTPAPPMAEGAYARFKTPDAKGLVILRLTPTAGEKLTIALGNLPIARKFTIYGSEAPCSAPGTSADVEFKVTEVPDYAAGSDVRFVARTRMIGSEDISGLQSVRIVEGPRIDGPLVACASSFFFDLGAELAA
jgi:hypothetical protein